MFDYVLVTGKISPSLLHLAVCKLHEAELKELNEKDTENIVQDMVTLPILFQWISVACFGACMFMI